MQETQAVAPPEFKDRRIGLIVCGIFEVIIGLICALLVPLTILGMVAQARMQDGGMSGSMRMMIPGVGFYALLAVFFIWIGIGSIMARRWARAVMLVISALWLLTGIFGMVAWLFMMPIIVDQMTTAGASGCAPPSFAEIFMIVMGVFLTFIYLIIPGILTLFYRSPNVKATCDARDPVERWTDKCPIPVLALVIIMFYSAISMLFALPFKLIPFFGVLLSGIPSIVVLVALGAAMFWAARASHRLDPIGWWLSLTSVTLGAVSMAITWTRIDMMEYYEAIGMSGQQLESMEMYSVFTGPKMAIGSLVPFLCFVAYLVYIKRYFKKT